MATANKVKKGGNIRKVTRTKNGKKYTYWEARITTGYDSGTGKQIQRSFTGKTQSEVLQKMQTATVEVMTGTYEEPNKITVKQWFELWLNEYCTGVKYGTLKNYRSLTNNHIIPALGSIKLQSLKAVDVQKFLNSCAASDNLSAKTVSNINGVLTSALNKAVALDYLRINPILNKVKIPRVKRGINSKDIKPLTEQEIPLFLKEAKKDPYYDILRVILFLGLREAEAIGLTWDCIDFTSNTVKVYRQWQKRPKKDGGNTFSTLKNDKKRTITASDYVMQIFREAKANQKLLKAQFGAVWEGNAKEYPFVFTNELGQPVHCKTL